MFGALWIVPTGERDLGDNRFSAAFLFWCTEYFGINPSIDILPYLSVSEE